MKAHRVREASRIAPATIPMLLIRVLRKTTVRKTIVRRTTALFLVQVARKTVLARLTTIVRVKLGRMKHRDRVRRPRGVRVG